MKSNGPQSPEGATARIEAISDLNRVAIRLMLQSEPHSEQVAISDLFTEPHLHPAPYVNQEAQSYLDDLALNKRKITIHTASDGKPIRRDGYAIDEDWHIAVLGAEDGSLSTAQELAHKGLPWLAPVMVRYDMLCSEYNKYGALFSAFSLRYAVNAADVHTAILVQPPYNNETLEQSPVDAIVPSLYQEMSAPLYGGSSTDEHSWVSLPAHMLHTLEGDPKVYSASSEEYPDGIFIDNASLSLMSIRNLTAFLQRQNDPNFRENLPAEWTAAWPIKPCTL